MTQGLYLIALMPIMEHLYISEHKYSRLEERHPSGPVQEGIGRFVTMRQLVCHPVVVSYWDRIQDDLLEVDY